MRLKFLFIFIAVVMFGIGLIFLTSCSSSVATHNSDVVLNVYNWGEYISDGSDGNLDTNEEFTKETGIKVNYTTFASNEEMYSKISSGGGVYDVIIPSDYMIARLKHEGKLAPLDFSKIPNAKYIDNDFKNLDFDKTNEYSVAYTWGYTGIIYNKRYVKEPVVSWDLLWDEKYSGKILMFDNSRDAFAIPQFLFNMSINSTNPQDWDKAAEKLKQQKTVIQSYVMDQIYNKMGNNEAWIAPYYAGDAVMLMEQNPDLDFALPQEGTNLFVDAMCIPANSPHKEEAMKYINFMCRPEISSANMEAIIYSTPISSARELMDKELVNNKILYPDNEKLTNAQVFSDLPYNVSVHADKLWVDVKTGTADNPIGFAIVIVCFIALYIGIKIYKKLKDK